MQYVVFALTCFPFNSQAARILSKAHFVPAIRVPRHALMIAGELGNGTHKTVNDPAAPRDVDAEMPVQKAEGPIDVEAERAALMQAVQNLVAQPKLPWAIDECLGRGAPVPKMDYQVNDQSITPDWPITRMSSPDGAFGIIDGRGMTDLALWTPFNLPSLLVMITERETVLNDADVLKDAEYNLLPPQGQEWQRVSRGECCGNRATLSLENQGDQVRAKIKCLGAPAGGRCRKKPSIQLLFDRSDCGAGLECKEMESAYIRDYGMGECKPA